MSDTGSDVDSISDASTGHSDEALISPAIRQLCNQLRANDYSSRFIPSHFLRGCTEAECIAVFQALKENTSVKHIAFEFSMLFELNNYTERSALVTAEYVESSKTLQSLGLSYGHHQYYDEGHKMISIVLRALSRNKSVTKLLSEIGVVTFASVAFEELLTRTQTLQKLHIVGYENEPFYQEVQIAAIASGFANNTTLCDLEFNSWREADLTPVLIALQCHPALKKINISADYWDMSFDSLPSLSGLEVLLRSHDSKVKELVLGQVDTNTVGLHSVLRELGRNTTVANLAIRDSVLSRENVQQLKAVLRQNLVIQSLDLTSGDSSPLGSAGLAEITPLLYRNTSIKTLNLSSNGLDDIESANLLRELLRRNKTITSICLAENTFGRNAAAARSLFEGLRSNTAL
jgi:hypothetical protein